MFEFEVYGYYETPAKLGDLTLHKIIDSLNSELCVNKRREFYHMDAKSAYDFLRAVAELSGTEDRMKLLDEDDEVIPEKAGSIFVLRFMQNLNKESEILIHSRNRFEKS